MRAELVVDCINQHGEGIFWNPADGLVWWTDIEGCTLWSFDPSTLKSASRKMAERVCCFAPRASGGLIVAYADRVVLFDPDTGEESLVTEFESGNPETRLNDGRTDRQGRLIVGGMNEVSGKADSSVICIDTDLKVRTIIEGVSCANSTCFSPDGATMFFADTPDREIVAFDYDTASGSVSSRLSNTPLSRKNLAYLMAPAWMRKAACGMPNGKATASCVWRRTARSTA
ncbi:SMP-30/gluconolactonase/LRE family protein [Phaeobacter sp. BS23]|uniref:SMP-30/gluconolactonase/LRE family protein n=1 Tax=Phaeobacter sp. BS23 TaxID=2907239 RepID=UPI00386EECDA